jgi:hypothetical protein
MKLAMATAFVAAALFGGTAETVWAVGPIETVWDGFSANYGQDRGVQVAQMLATKRSFEVTYTEEDPSTAEMNWSAPTAAPNSGQDEMRVGHRERQHDGVMSVSESGRSRDRVMQVK